VRGVGDEELGEQFAPFPHEVTPGFALDDVLHSRISNNRR